MNKSLELKVLILAGGMLLIVTLLAGALAVSVQRSTLLRVIETSAETTGRVIAEEIESTMLTGNADVTRQSVSHLKEIRGLEEIQVFNAEGKEAFRPGATASAADLMAELRKEKDFIIRRSDASVVFAMPMKNIPTCQKCHSADKPLLGAIRVSLSVEKEMSTARNQLILVVLGLVAVSLVFSGLLWYTLRKIVIRPVQALEAAAAKIADGDISFSTDIRGEDELARLSALLKDSSRSLGGVFSRIKDLSTRISRVTESVEKEAQNIVRSAEIENEAIVNISNSIEELSATAEEISDSTDGLASSSEDTSASMEQMVSSISTVNVNMQDLSAAVESTSSSIEQLSATIREVAGNAETLSTSAEETLSAISEITAAIREVEQNAKESARQSEKVSSDAATLGVSAVEKTADGMRNIKAAVERTADVVRKLGGRSDEIGKILTVIDDVTDQTTLLALNAAILAAQAGEHGKGFSVVAEEIKELAERTAFSTQEIGNLIEAVQLEVKNAVEAMHEGLASVDQGTRLTREAGDALRMILDNSKKSTEMSRAIERSTGEQSKAAKLVSEAMEQTRNMTDQIAKATAEESKGAMLIIKATEKMRDVARQVSKAMQEQTSSSKQISSAMDVAVEKSQQISRALSEHKIGSRNILNSIEGVKGIPVENRKIAFKVSNTLRELHKDSELLSMEMERFRFYEGASNAIRLGVLPFESPAVMYRKLSPLAEYLTHRLGRPVELKVAVDFESAIREVGQQITHLCALGPATYIEAHKRFNIRTLVKALRNGKPYHFSVIITKNDSTIRELRDIRGRSFAFGDASSTAGHIAPRIILKDQGIELEDLASYRHLGYHDEVALAVLKGEFDAGAVIESVAARYRDKGLRYLYTSEGIPELCICAGGALDAADGAVIKAALISLTDATAEGGAVLKSIDPGYTGFAAADDSDYEGVRTMMARLGMK